MKKEIVIIMSALHGGGAEKVLIDYLRNFDYKKFKVTLCLVLQEGVYLSDLPEAVELVYLYEKFGMFPYRFEHWFSKYFRVDWFQKRRVKKVLKRKHFDTVISYMEGIPLKFHKYFLKYANRHITWVHLDLFNFHYSLTIFGNKKQEEQIYKRMDAIVFVSEDAKKQFHRLYPLNVPKKVIYNIIDKKAIENHITNTYSFNSTIKIGAVGRLENQKRFDRLIAAAALLKKDGFHFLVNIIGEGNLRFDLEKAIKENDLTEYVYLKGFVKPPYNLINECDLIVATSEAEGFSLVVAEALCLGKAVISTATAGPTELLDNGKYGIICEHDVNAIYEAIKLLISDRDKLELYQNLAKERSAFFEVKQSIEALEKLIENV